MPAAPAAPASDSVRIAPLPAGAQHATREELEAIGRAAVDGQSTIRASFPAAEIRVEVVEEGKPGKIKACINTNEIDRYDSIVEPGGAELENYLLNPVVLWMHGLDFAGSWPVGRVTKIDRSDKSIEVELEFDTKGSLGGELDRLYREGWLRGFSVGFIPHEYVVEMIDDRYILRYTRWELLELSCVAVGGNAHALKRALQAGEIRDAHLIEHLAEHVELVEKSVVPVETQETRTVEDLLPAVESVIRKILDENRAKMAEAAAPLRTDGSEEAVERFAVEWQAPWCEEAELRAAADAAVPLMAAVCVDRRGTTEAMLLHHHADSRLSSRALLVCMARLLTQPLDMTAEQKDAAYEHLAAHFRQLDIAPPEAGGKTAEQAYDLALEGRIAHIDAAGYGWHFVEAVEHEGRHFAGFERIDDPQARQVLPPPGIGRLTDHRHWGKRAAVKIDRDEELLQQLADQQRRVADELERRSGAEFSKKNRARIGDAASQLENVAKSLSEAITGLSSTAETLRNMVSDQTEESDDSGSGRSVGSQAKGTGQQPQPGTGKGRRL